MKWSAEIVAYLRSHGPATPTMIGISVGGREKAQASAWVAPKLKRLVQEGSIERGQHHGHYQAVQADGEGQQS